MMKINPSHYVPNGIGLQRAIIAASQDEEQYQATALQVCQALWKGTDPYAILIYPLEGRSPLQWVKESLDIEVSRGNIHVEGEYYLLDVVFELKA